MKTCGIEEIVNKLESDICQLEDEKKKLNDDNKRKKTFIIESICRHLENKAFFKEIENKMLKLRDENIKLKKNINYLVYQLKKKEEDRLKECQEINRSRHDGIEALLTIINS